MKIIFIFLITYSIAQDTLKTNLPLAGEKFIEAGNFNYYSKITDVFGLLPISLALNFYSNSQIGKAGNILSENENNLESELGKHLINYKFHKQLKPVSLITSLAIIGNMNTNKRNANNVIPIVWSSYISNLYLTFASLKNLNEASSKLNLISDNTSSKMIWEASRNFQNYTKINLIGTSLQQIGLGMLIYHGIKLNYSNTKYEYDYFLFAGGTSIFTGYLLNKIIAPWFLRTTGQYLIEINWIK